MKSQRKFMKNWFQKKYHDRGINGRVKKLGGWGGIAERKTIDRIARTISDEIDREILKQLTDYAKTYIHSENTHK